MLYPEAWALLYNAAKKIFSFLKFIPSNQSIAFVKRYLNIMKFANYDKQKRIFDKLIKMSEADARFVVLPMDMEFMKAGKPQQSYLAQLEEINGVFEKSMKNCDKMIPFLFVDPRRIRAKEGKTFFDWEISEKVVDRTKKKVVILKDCLVKTYLEKEQNNPAKGNFKGIKLYPALGYYPFDEDLLALYYYCVDNEIPVLTHCVKGSIFWRGRMYKKWNRHPVFERANSPLETRAHNNYELQVNFTHPLNYLVLLENRFLYRVIKRSKNARLKELFDFDATRKYVSNKLSKLSLNIAHYGGVEEWEKYLRLDRNETAFELIENPEQGMSLTTSQSSGFELLSKPADLYHKKADWFSIISSMMLQYDNVYSDISYILHSSKMMPLLNDVLINNEKLAKKILYGTDFFVVRNHKSEKQLYSDLLATIGEDNMDKIARENPFKWLKI
jgi:predicted TIM-barrel fold metal-dependent hydrolase